MKPTYLDDTVENYIEKHQAPVAAEIKEDGYRLQAHVDHDKVVMFSRSCEFEPRVLPEIVEALQALDLEETIIDCEVKGTNGSRYDGFNAIKARARYKGRISDKSLEKYHDQGKTEQFPLELVVFDVLMHNGKNTAKLPYNQRREIVEQIQGQGISPSEQHLCYTAEEIDALFQQASEKGMEGLVLKPTISQNKKKPKQSTEYIPGDKSVWAKLKKFESLDLTVVGLYTSTNQEWAENCPYVSALVAAYNPETEKYETIGKIGLSRINKQTQQSFAHDLDQQLANALTQQQSENVDYGQRQPNLYIDPEQSVVMQVRPMNIDYNTSNGNACGHTKGAKTYSLRIGWVETIRDDKTVLESSTTDLVEQIYKNQ